ncbi:MAG: HTH domain-containing protein [Candidatus Micrarchaeia archaeon]
MELKDKILHLLKQNRRGMTIKQLGEDTGVSRETISKNLQALEYENEVYPVKFGNVQVYCSNHRKYKDRDVLKLNFGNRTIYINRLENEFGEFIKISETRKKEGNWKSMGSILVPPNDLQKLIDALKSIEERPGELEKGAE